MPMLKHTLLIIRFPFSKVVEKVLIGSFSRNLRRELRFDLFIFIVLSLYLSLRKCIREGERLESEERRQKQGRGNMNVANALFKIFVTFLSIIGKVELKEGYTLCVEFDLIPANCQLPRVEWLASWEDLRSVALMRQKIERTEI